MGISDHLTCLLRNLYAGQEATVRIRHGTKDWFQIGKGVHEGCILSPCLFNLYTEYIMKNAGLDEIKAGIKIAGRNINNLRYAGDTMLKAESRKYKKGRGTEIKLPTSIGSLKNQENSRKTSTSALLTTPKPLTMWITTNCAKFLKKWEHQTTLPAS